MGLINYTTFPPGGYPYTQPETGQQFHGMVPFDMQKHAISQHRKANQLARSSVEESSQDLEDFTCNRLGQDPAYCIDKKKLFPEVSQFFHGHVARAAGNVRAIATGAEILAEWLGDGGEPVSSDRSQARADVCTGRSSGKPCVYNVQGHFPVTTAIAHAIHEQRKKKTQLKLEVAGESELGTCGICQCHMPLKIHVPIKTIYGHTGDEMIKRFPAHCWIPQEIEKFKTNPA